MAVALNVVTGAYPAFEASATTGAGILVTLAPYVGAALVTEIEALTTGTGSQYNTMIAELVQAVRTLQGG